MTFDSVAATYDLTFGASPAGRLFRFRLAERVQSEVPPPRRLLDIGCGTGDDALWFAEQGYDVTAIDASPRMIEVASRKIRSRRRAPAFTASTLQDFAGGGTTFDVVVSDFGALNCVPLAAWAAAVERLLAPSGRAFLALMGRRPLPEGVRHGFRTADRKEFAEVRVGDGTVRVEYPSRESIDAALRGKLKVARREALGCLTPGPGYAAFPRRHPLVFAALAALETMARRAWGFRDRGDHVLLELVRP